MILYWAWPPDGAGHAVRAAAICRHLDSEVLVLRGNDDPVVNRALTHFQIPFIVIAGRHDAIRFAMEMRAKTVVLDDAAGTQLDTIASLYLWRLGRPERPHRPMPMIRLEGTGSIWPAVMLEEEEILSREEAREDLGIDQDAHVRASVTSTCRPGLIEAFDDQVDLVLDEWPALRWMRAADHVVGAPGFNLWGEVHYCGLPATWVKAPHARDQAVRLQVMPRDEPQLGAAKRIAQMIEQIHQGL